MKKVMDIVNMFREFLLNSVVLKKRKEVVLSYYGSEYGGFYVYDCFDGKDTPLIVYSFGIGEDLSFSEALKKTHDCEIYAFDPTPKSAQYVRKHPLYADESFHFYKIGLSGHNKKTIFYLPENEEFVSGSMVSHAGLKKNGIEVTMKNLRTITRKLNHSHIDILKMDIEGTEFEVIDKLKNDLSIDQVCMETHSRFFSLGLVKLYRMNKKMSNLGFVLVGRFNDDLTYVHKSVLN